MRTISCMKLEPEVLNENAAENLTYSRGHVIFREGTTPEYYYQIITGEVKICHLNDEGREFIHNILGPGQSFGDAMLFIDHKYPARAVAISTCTVARMPKDNLLRLLRNRADLAFQMNACLSHQLYFKTLMIQNMASPNASKRILALLNYLKSYQECGDAFSFTVHFTRQQIADLTGLRVETVIRTLKQMEKESVLKIENRKLLY